MKNDVGAVIALEPPFMCDIDGVEGGEFIFAASLSSPVLNVYSAMWAR
jgi:hypothetical protein